MKRILSTLLFFSLAVITQGQTVLIEENIHGPVYVCDTVQITYRFTNSYDEDLIDVKISLNFPPGISYVAGSIEGASETSAQKDPTFVKTSIASGKIDSIVLSIAADCEARSKEGQKFVNTMSLESGQGKYIFESRPPYTIRTPFLIIADVHPVDTMITAMHTAHRFVTIQNTRLGRLKTVIFEDAHEAGTVTSTTGKVLIQTSNLLRVLLDSSDFKKIGNEDAFFDYNEKIVLEELISLDSCNTGLVRSDILVQWGCNDEVCQEEQFTDVVVEVKQLIEKARLDLSMNANYPKCPCDPEEQTLTICNNGLSSSTNTVLELHQTSKNPIGVLPDPIWMMRGTDSIPLEVFSKQKPICGPIYAKYYVQLPEIAPGECIDIHFYYTQCSQFLGLNVHNPFDLVLKSKVKYASLCAENNKDSSSIKVRKASDLNAQLVAFQTSEIVKDGDKVSIHFQIRSRNLTQYRHGQLTILYPVPCGFIAHPDRFVIAGRHPYLTRTVVDTTEPPSTLVYASYKLPFRRDTVEGYLDLEFTCDTPCLKRGNLAEVLVIHSSCPLGDAFSKLKAFSEHCIGLIMSDCPLEEPEDICGYFIERASVKTPIMCHSGDTLEQYAPGYVDFTGSIERLNIGLTDEDNDRLPDTPLVAANRARIRHNRCLEHDTLRLRFEGEIFSDFPELPYDRMYVSPGMNSNFFELLRAEITIKDYSTGQTYHCYSDSLGIITGQGEIGECRTIVNPASTTTGASVIFHPSYLKTLGCGIPDDFFYEDRDSIFVNVDFVASTDRRYRHGLTFPVNSRIFIFTESYQHQPFYCTEYKDSIEYGKLIYNIEPLGSAPDIDPCAPPNARSYYHLFMNEGMANFFPNEFRPFVSLEDFFYTIDPAITLDSVVLHYYYPDTSVIVQNIVHKSTIIPQRTPPSHKWVFPVKQDFALDEAYDVLIYPYISLKDCHDLVSGFTDSVQTTRIITNHIGPDVYFYNTNDAELVRHLWRHAYGFERDRDYNLFSYSIPTLQLRSTTDKGQWQGHITHLDSSLKEVRFKIISLSPELNNVRIRDNHGRVYLENDGEIVIKPLSDSITDLTIIADNESCDWQYLKIISGWNCDTTGDFFATACSVDTFNLSVKSYPPELEMDISTTPGPFDICDTMRYVEVSVWNANRGAAFHVRLDMDLPLGFNLLADELVYSFDDANHFIPMPLPEERAPGQYQWQMNDLIEQYKEDGWPGVEMTYSKIHIRVSGTLDCNFQPGAYLHFQVKGVSNCYIPTNIVRRNSAPINIRNTDPSTKTISFNGSHMEPGHFTCQAEGRLFVQLFASKPFSTGDKIQIILPAGLLYRPQSIQAISHFTAKEPRIITVNGRTVLEWDASEVIDGFVDIAFSVGVTTDPDLLDCDTYEIRIQGTHSSKAICKTTGLECNLDVIEGSESVRFSMDKGHISLLHIDSLTSSEPSGIRLCFKLTGEWKDLPFYADSFHFILTGDRTGNGLSPDDIEVQTFSVHDTIYPNDTSKICIHFPGQLPAGICHFILSFPEGENCICTPATATFSIMPPDLYFTDTLCPGASTEIGIAKIEGASYHWEGMDLACTDCAANMVTHTFQNDSIFSRQYRLTVSDASLCAQIYHYTLYFLPVYEPDLIDFELCPGDSIVLTIEGVRDIIWDGADPAAPLKGSPSIAHPTKSNTWTVRFTDPNDCPGSGQFEVRVFDVDQGQFTISPDTSIFPGGTAHLWVKGPGTFEWEPVTTLSCSQCDRPDASPDSTTTYTVTIIDENGCEHILDVTVTVLPPPCDPSIVFVPNAFSPNADGVNDLLYVRGHFIDQIEFVIYDRWGEKVFETFDISVPWDGTFKGVALTPDVYSYYLKVRCTGGEDLIKTGNISILK